MLTYEWLVQEGHLFELVFGTLFIVIVAGTAWQMIRMKLCRVLKIQETSYGRNPYYGADSLRCALVELADVAKKTAVIDERSEVTISRDAIQKNHEVFSAIVNILSRTGCTMSIKNPEEETILTVGDNLRIDN